MTAILYDDEQTIFKTTVPVLVAHLNYGNHLGYDAMLTLIQDARIRWLKKYGMGENAIDNTTGFVAKEVHVDYKAEAFHDDLLEITLYISALGNTSFSLQYKVTNAVSQKVVALVETKQVFFDYVSRKVARAPARFVSMAKEISISSL